MLSGLVSTIGFGLIGPAVVGVASALARERGVTGRIATLGHVTGWLMTVGVLAVVPAVLRFDSIETTPVWAWAIYVSWFGTCFGCPAWAFASGRRVRS
jgi:hypothetical protein